MKVLLAEREGPAHEAVACRVQPPPGPPGPRQVLLGMLAMPVNPADLLLVEGRYGVRRPLPFVPGHEGVGRILQVGAEVQGLAAGDLVVPLGDSCWAEQMLVSAAASVALPAGTDLLQASMLKANPATAWVMLRDLVPLAPGDWLVQNAANSAVGSFVRSLAAAAGVRTVNLVRRPQAVPDAPVRADELWVVDDGRDAARVREAVDAGTGAAPIRLALDAIGGGATERLGQLVAEGGTVVNYGLLSGEACRMASHDVVFRDVLLRGFWLARWFRTADRSRVRAMYAELAALLAQRRLHAPVAACYPMDEVAAALRHAAAVERGGKVVLLTDEGMRALAR